MSNSCTTSLQIYSYDRKGILTDEYVLIPEHGLTIKQARKAAEKINRACDRLERKTKSISVSSE